MRKFSTVCNFGDFLTLEMVFVLRIKPELRKSDECCSYKGTDLLEGAVNIALVFESAQEVHITGLICCQRKGYSIGK